MRYDSAFPNISTVYVRREGKWAWLGTVFMLVYLSTPAHATQVRIIQGQIVRLKLHNVLTTENVEKDDPVDFDVAEDVVVATHVVIPKGAPARGKVIRVKGAGKKKAKDASVTFRFVSVRSVDNQDIPLRGAREKPKKEDSKENEIEANEPLPGYAERLIGAEKGTEYAAYVDTSTTVNAPETPVITPPIAPVTPVQQPQPSVTQPASPGGSTPPVATPPTPGEQALVEFNSDPQGADILLDGTFVGSTPSTLRINPGRHVIELRAGGYRGWTRTMMVDPDSHPTIHATLEKQ